jgi:hypothetical protein
MTAAVQYEVLLFSFGDLLHIKTIPDLISGLVNCMNNEDCVGSNRRCLHNKAGGLPSAVAFSHKKSHFQGFSVIITLLVYYWAIFCRQMFSMKIIPGGGGPNPPEVKSVT